MVRSTHSIAYRTGASTLLVAMAFLFAIVALLLGKKTGWDLFNYHWYNAYAFFHDRFMFDMVIAHHATYYNPIADLPLYLLTSSEFLDAPSWVGGLYMGSTAGIAASLVGLIGFHVMPQSTKHRWLLSGAIATASLTGAGAFQEIGDPASDIATAIGIFIAIALIVRQLSRTATLSWNRTSFIAGLFVGLSVAIKLTTAIYAIGIGVGLLCLGLPVTQRFRIAFAFAVGALLSLVAFDGFWMWKLWCFSGNPFFPYFNDLFHSPLLLSQSYRDPNFGPRGVLETFIFPAIFTADSRAVSESVFRDARVLVVYFLIPVVLCWRLITNHREPLPASARFLLVFAATSYIVWLGMFDIYRYLIPLEMLCPVLIMVTCYAIPLSTRPLVITAALVIVAQFFVRIDISDRQSWSGPYVQVDAPSIENPEATLVLMTGHAPMAYVIPSFPRSIPFIRIDSWLVQAGDLTSGLSRMMRQRVVNHAGPLKVLFQSDEEALATDALRHYGLKLMRTGCEKVGSNINETLLLCPVQRVDVTS